VNNVEYRIPIVGPVTFAFFADTGMNMAIRQSQLRLSNQQFTALDNTPFGCPAYDSTFIACQGTQFLKFNQNLTPLAGTNYVVRMSTGAELQVILPVVNAPFRIFYAYNPLRVDTEAPNTSLIAPSMFPNNSQCMTNPSCNTGAGQYTYQNALATYTPPYRLREPRKTFRFTVATTF
jgi:outer membrane protein insertion porin family